MTTIPQVARAMREILTTTAAEAGRATRFVQRTSPLSGATFSQTLVFGFLGNPQATLEELTQTAAALGIEISPQALDQRFTASAAACLHQVLVAAIARVITAEPVAIPLLERSLNLSQFVARKYWLKCDVLLHRLRANCVQIRRVSWR